MFENIKRTSSIVIATCLMCMHNFPLMCDNQVNVKELFTDICHQNYWQGVESVSGTGSDLNQTVIIRQEIPKLLKKLGVEIVLDAACGSFNWIKEMDLPVKKYIGVDIVSDLIETNKRLYTTEKIEFYVINLVSDTLPKADLILCRDCLVHYDYASVKTIIENLKKSGATYLLATTFTWNNRSNSSITGAPGYSWQPYNMQKPPFNFPEPIEIINEKLSHPYYLDKSLALWRLADL